MSLKLGSKVSAQFREQKEELAEFVKSNSGILERAQPEITGELVLAIAAKSCGGRNPAQNDAC
jgi:hypothetical protein